MARFRTILAASCVLALAAPPVRAAEDFVDRTGQPSRAAPYAGLSLRAALGGRHAARPVARLQFGMRDADSAARPVAGAVGPARAMFEFGTSAAGQPAFLVGGAELGEIEQRFGLDFGGIVLAVAGGVALVGLLLVAAGSSGNDDECFFDCGPF